MLLQKSTLFLLFITSMQHIITTPAFVHIPDDKTLRHQFAQKSRLIPLINNETVTNLANRTVSLPELYAIINHAVNTYYYKAIQPTSNSIKREMFNVYRTNGFFTSDGQAVQLKISDRVWTPR